MDEQQKLEFIEQQRQAYLKQHNKLMKMLEVLPQFIERFGTLQKGDVKEFKQIMRAEQAAMKTLIAGFPPPEE
jgi:hypothetical protein